MPFFFAIDSLAQEGRTSMFSTYQLPTRRKGPTLDNRLKLASVATQNYIDTLSGVVFMQSKYKNISTFTFAKLLDASRTLGQYTSLIEELDNFKVSIDLSDFHGEI